MSESNVQVQQQPQMFYPEKVYRSYTAKQWTLKEDWYIAQVQNISIPIAPNPADIASVANQIEAALSTARLDMGFIKQNCDKYNMMMKLYEKELYTTLKNDPTINVTGKLTVAEIESHVVKTINKVPWDGGTMNLYELVQLTSGRSTFMDGVVKALCDKKDLLITHSSVIKAEMSLNGMGNNGQGQHYGNRNYTPPQQNY